ncbi:MAG: FAD-binding oxidoreductase [Candidatus Thioglobus sp.]|nr:MAG: FAD-binding oxidoreductase [Candidatus Thioglobus sp.]
MTEVKNSPLEGDSRLAARLGSEIEGDVWFDAFSRGRYSTDASAYQIEPIGVVVPRTWQDVISAIQIAADEEIAVLPRGAGTSQCGQTVGEALVIDTSAYLNSVIKLDPDRQRVCVEPGMVLDHLNRCLSSHGLMFPVDVSTAAQATIGGMTGNNSCGARSIRYGTMRDNVRAISGILADGRRRRFDTLEEDAPRDGLEKQLLEIGVSEAQEISRRFPKVQRRVGGYNVDALAASSGAEGINLAHLLVGSEGTLAFSEAIELQLVQVPKHKVLGVCHFPNFYAAMEASQHLVTLDPAAVELVDQTMIELSRQNPVFRPVIERCVKGEPEALLLVEFAGESYDEQLVTLKRLHELMDDLGFADSVVDAVDPQFQKDIWEVRKAGLNIMMSMKGDGKPISFIEDCAVRLEDLAEYTRRLTEIFTKHGTSGTWYAHASVGCLHVRPVLNLKQELDVKKMRTIAEEAFAMVREYKGSHSGEHGDGLVRSEFHEAMFGKRMVDTFAQVKHLFDPQGTFNPGKIVNPSRMDDRSLFRFKPGYRTQNLDTAMDWSAWGGFSGAVEMCNNNGACRKRDANVMCPSYRATRQEKHLTRGRANSLRLALSGQLGEEAFTSKKMHESMQLCVSCKGCRRECPTGVDMAKMKIEFLHHYHSRHGVPARERLIAELPRYAPWLSRVSGLANLRNRSRLLKNLGHRVLGLSAERQLPHWAGHSFSNTASEAGENRNGELVLFADTFNRYFDPDVLRAAVKVLTKAGYRVHLPGVKGGEARPLCCGRTYLASGMMQRAKEEAQRTLDALQPYLEAGMPVVGLEPSCLFTFQDEFASLLAGETVARLADQTQMFEQFLLGEGYEGFSQLEWVPAPGQKAFVHGHCHQKAFNAHDAAYQLLTEVPGLTTEAIRSGCCGMAGAFGYQRETQEASAQMAELDLLPAVRGTDSNDWLVADGFSCRHQIKDLAHRDARHMAQVLAGLLA